MPPQGTVDCRSRLLVTSEVSQRPTDRTLLATAIEACRKLPEEVGVVSEMLADAGYFSASNVEACLAAGMTPYIATRRESHARRAPTIPRTPSAQSERLTR